MSSSALELVLLGGAPGVGKSSVARRLLLRFREGARFVQWIDVDALWLHQPWRVDDTTTTMLQANLRALLHNAAAAHVDSIIVTWVFQNADFHDLVTALAPNGSTATRIQLLAPEKVWRERFAGDSARPEINDFYVDRYEAAQSVCAEHRIDTDGLDPAAVAELIAGRLDW